MPGGSGAKVSVQGCDDHHWLADLLVDDPIMETFLRMSVEISLCLRRDLGSDEIDKRQKR